MFEYERDRMEFEEGYVLDETLEGEIIKEEPPENEAISKHEVSDEDCLEHNPDEEEEEESDPSLTYIESDLHCDSGECVADDQKKLIPNQINIKSKIAEKELKENKHKKNSKKYIVRKRKESTQKTTKRFSTNVSNSWLQQNAPIEKTLSINKPRKNVKSTLALCKHPNSGEFCILLFTAQNKTGTKYNLKSNIKQVLTRFANEGKCTIQFKVPEHDLYINCDTIQLKGFLHLLKRVLENKVSDKEFSVSSMAVTPVRPQDVAPTKLAISKRSDYPVKGFPRTLEELRINDIDRCAVDVGIFRLSKLKVLDLSSNSIEFIPEELNALPNLKELNLSYNRLHNGTLRQWGWMSGNLSKSLLLLDLSHNELAVLPNQICKLHQLQTLNLNFNILRALPAGLGNLKNLKTLSAANNNITSLPGSMKKLRLQSIDVSHNKFLEHVPARAATLSSPLKVCSLKEYASRKVLGARLPYPPGALPLTVINYLDNASFCVCGKACFDVFFRSSHNLMLTNIAESVSTSVGEKMYVPIDCCFCSLKCYSFAFQTRTRHPIVR
ncbi:hypothetical protein JTB14_036792 [Gonioctena quinquepunctata]|nr:hypothetical protein JTB14_036792 [Gonioctena quinquepunctata]